ncbi:nucleoside/nucleotide kinase family protein [Vallitalea okinawensis]|uniref:hypothetical protein n=1 Tax=Vallitalea okinawensis TaxID=2078660 RepID=UPI000CFC577F|nr:hypothetical protein [Vallitalea okinawensis]
MKTNRPNVIAISAVSGGGKTTIINNLKEKLPNVKTFYFDDYDFNGPKDFKEWVENGADYNEWDLDPFISDIKCLLSNKSSVEWILLDYPFAYKNDCMSKYIDYALFIDTPLDIAMARRILRDFGNTSKKNISDELTCYMNFGRAAYIEMLNQVKPSSDMIIDGLLDIDEIVSSILQSIIKEEETIL